MTSSVPSFGGESVRPPRRLFSAASPAVKFFLVGGLIVLLLVPLMLVKGLVDERAAYADGARGEIALGWGGAQTIVGPFLVVPYTVSETAFVDGRQTLREAPRTLVVLPRRFEAATTAGTEVLKRAIYAVTGYRAEVTLAGAFDPLSRTDFPGDVVRIDWTRATLSLSLSDPTALRDGVDLERPGASPLAFEPGLGTGGGSGIHVRPFAGVEAAADGVPALAFTIPLKLSGTDSLAIAPVGRDSAVTIASDWPHPSFFGSFLPESRTVEASGFSASWKVPDLARPVAQTLASVDAVLTGFSGATLGVRFLDPVDFYALVDRAVKYGVLFLAVAFGGVFAMELASRGRFHPVQYVFVGIASVLFYVLLLALSEVIGFTPAYAVASAALVAQLAAYVGVALSSRNAGLTMAAILAVALALLYALLQTQAYALLVGTVAAFVVLTAAMFLTLKVDWTGGRPASPPPAAPPPEPGDVERAMAPL
jgi:inner membrane protein